MSDAPRLSGLDPAEAREIVYRYELAGRDARRRREQLEGELATWSKRATLAAEKDRPDLKDAALAKCLEIQHQLDALDIEQSQFDAEVASMRKELRALTIAAERTIDAEALLARLEAVGARPDPTSDAFRNLSAETELERLKKKLQDEG